MGTPHLVILGGGPGGYVAAIRAAQRKARVTVVDEGGLGGTCLHRGCIPSKAMFACAELLDHIRRAEEFGLHLQGSVEPDLGRIVERNRRIIAAQHRGIQSLLTSWGIRHITGRGRLLDARTVEATTAEGQMERLAADRMILATGSRPQRLPALLTPAANSRIVMTSDEVLELTERPAHLLVIGGGVEGCEFAVFFQLLGSSVTVVEREPRLLPTEDEEIAGVLSREMQKRGITLKMGTTVAQLDPLAHGVTVTLTGGDRLTADRVLLAVGRQANTDGLGCEHAGVALGPRGEVQVDERMATSVPGIYAIGDVAGQRMLAHVASREAKIAVENALGGEAKMDYTAVPAGIFTWPEIGTVGLTEHQARAQGHTLRIGRSLFRTLGKAHAIGETAGLAKIIVDARTDRILGAHIVGPSAADLIHEVAVAMTAGLPARVLAETIHSHPTLSEAVLEAVEATHGEAIHSPRPLPSSTPENR